MQYYRPAEEVYPQADIQVQLEDTQDISQPMIPLPSNKKHFVLKEEEGLETSYDK